MTRITNSYAHSRVSLREGSANTEPSADSREAPACVIEFGRNNRAPFADGATDRHRSDAAAQGALKREQVKFAVRRWGSKSGPVFSTASTAIHPSMFHGGIIGHRLMRCNREAA